MYLKIALRSKDSGRKVTSIFSTLAPLSVSVSVSIRRRLFCLDVRFNSSSCPP
jgi:hypothetical protein